MSKKNLKSGGDKAASGSWKKAQGFLAEGNYAAARRVFTKIAEENSESDVAREANEEIALLNIDPGALIAAACFLLIYITLWLVVL